MDKFNLELGEQSSENIDRHPLFRNGGGAAVYINQSSTNSSFPILRGSSGTVVANQNVKFTFEHNGRFGLGTTTPESIFHVQKNDVGVTSYYGVVQIESLDMQVDFISSYEGTWGSCLNLIPLVGLIPRCLHRNDYCFFLFHASCACPEVLDLKEMEVLIQILWSIGRQTTNGLGDSSLRINFGTLNEHTNSNVVTFSSNNNEGIGTTTPDSKLTVAGDIHAQKVLFQNMIEKLVGIVQKK